jgi:hypothetical protein
MNFPLIGEPRSRFSLNNGPEAMAFGVSGCGNRVFGFWVLGFEF